MANTELEQLNINILEANFNTTKKTIQEYVREINRYCRFKSVQNAVVNGTVLDDRSKLIDQYEACVQQDAHLSSVVETLESQIVGERYMLARQNEKGRYVKDVEETKKIQGTQFVKIIRGIAESKLYGFTAIEILPEVDERTGRLKEVNLIERRNVLPDQKRIVRRQGIWLPGWDFEDKKYKDNYILINSGSLGLFSATTPLILAKKFTMANYVNFSHTYGQPIIHGKTEGESTSDRQRLANEIANAAQKKVIVTGLNDSVDVKAFTMSNSERIYTGLIEKVNQEVSNLILGSESMAGATQAYVGSTRAHQDIFRDRIAVYREYIENVMNEEIIPRLVAMGFLKDGLEFKYSNRLEMSNKEQIELFLGLADRFEVTAEEVDKAFGISVGQQLQLKMMQMTGDGNSEGQGMPERASFRTLSEDESEREEYEGEGDGSYSKRKIMSDREYLLRYGHPRASLNFLRERR